MIFLPASERAAQPWKNGGGVTREVAASPPDSGLDSFDWRVSIADVAIDGPFSLFPEIDRTLTILSGEGILLDVADRQHRLLPGAPHSFPGDQPAGATLLGGAVTDLNVMSRRGRIAHEVVPLASARTLRAAEGVLVWIAGTGRIVGPENSAEMGRFDALMAPTPEIWAIEGEDFLAYYAAFTRL